MEFRVGKEVDAACGRCPVPMERGRNESRVTSVLFWKSGR